MSDTRGRIPVAETDTHLDESALLGRVQHMHHIVGLRGMREPHVPCGANWKPGHGKPDDACCADCIEFEEGKRACVCGWRIP